MIITTKQLTVQALADQGLHGLWKGDPEATGDKAIYRSDETMPDGLGSYVFMGQIAETKTDTEIQTAVDNIVSADAVKERKLAKIRIERNQKLDEVDKIIQRDDDQKELGDPRTIDDAKRAEWLRYKQDLRDFPATCDPDNPVWPTEPT